MRVDHDISLLIPEIWCRLFPDERDPAFLIGEGHLEALEDFEHAGRTVLASRLGYRITAKFVRTFFGRVFDNPARVFNEEFLRPETQDLEVFVDGVDNIVEAQQRVARQYFEDGSIEDACPPLRALLPIMADGYVRGEGRPPSRTSAGCSRREALLASDWYRQRLVAKRTGRRAALEASPGLPRRPLGRASPRVARRVGRAVPPPRIRLGRAGAHQVPGLPRRIERRARPRSQPPAAGLSLRGRRLRSSVLRSNGFCWRIRAALGRHC